MLLRLGLSEQIDQDQQPTASKVSLTRVKAVLKVLSQEAGFLVDPGVKASEKGWDGGSTEVCFMATCAMITSFGGILGRVAATLPADKAEEQDTLSVPNSSWAR